MYRYCFRWIVSAITSVPFNAGFGNETNCISVCFWLPSYFWHSFTFPGISLLLFPLHIWMNVVLHFQFCFPPVSGMRRYTGSRFPLPRTCRTPCKNVGQLKQKVKTVQVLLRLHTTEVRKKGLVQTSFANVCWLELEQNYWLWLQTQTMFCLDALFAIHGQTLVIGASLLGCYWNFPEKVGVCSSQWHAALLTSFLPCFCCVVLR